MNAVVEAQSILRRVPREPDEFKLDWIERAGGVFGLTFSQAKKIIYGEVKDLRASRLDAMRDKLNQIQERAAARRERTDGIKERLAYLRSAHASRDHGGDSGGAGTPDSRGLGEGGCSGREGGRPTAVARPDEKKR